MNMAKVLRETRAVSSLKASITDADLTTECCCARRTPSCT